jgi:hypothetical protein
MGRFATPGGSNFHCPARVASRVPETVLFGVPEKRDRLAVKAHGASTRGGKAEPRLFITTN